MNLDKLQAEITADEGRVDKIYLCSEGHPTFGIGHLIVQSDPEYKSLCLDSFVGIKVSETRVREAFEADISVVLKDCEILYPDFYELQEEAQHIIANMCFQLGRPRLSKFKMMKAAVDARDFKEAAKQMLDSRWAKQTPNRAERLANRMLNLAMEKTNGTEKV
jgi:GH24 family phage-related lysozyme (muramidase)